MELERYQKMKKNVDALRVNANRAAGKVEQLMIQLQEKHDCSTIGEAQKKLKKLEKDKIRLKKDFDTKYKLFEAEWGEKLEELAG